MSSINAELSRMSSILFGRLVSLSRYVLPFSLMLSAACFRREVIEA